MKQTRQTLMVSIALMSVLFLLPLAVFRSEIKLPEVLAEPKEEPQALPFVSGARDSETVLNVLHGDTVEEMDLGTYLTCVVRAEMPASFEQEALCAQAVAARTYTLYKLRGGSNHTDVGADICTDSTCCQAFITEEAARANWGADADRYEKKVEQAVKDTDGQVIFYDGAPILAVFHSCSAGQTRSAGEVWQDDLPYLQPVSSPEPVDKIPNYYSRMEFSTETFQERIRGNYPEADFSGDVKNWLKHAARDSAGSVETLEVGGVTMKGAVLRSLLGLRSACFEWQIEDGKIVFYVTGYGHGVGMSQYGANQMAQDGASWQEILTHYYKDVTLAPYTGEA